MSMYSTGDILQLFKANGRDSISRQTISNWCKEFEQYLSVTANPPTGGHRRFSETDLGVLALISSMKEMGSTYEDIHASLQSGQRGRLLEPASTALAPASRQLLVLEGRITDLEEQLEMISQERNQLKTQLAVRDALLEQAREQIVDRDAKIASVEQEIRKLYTEIGRLSADNKE
jgi:DNA-binding transcriptional MerR regulator